MSVPKHYPWIVRFVLLFRRRSLDPPSWRTLIPLDISGERG